jgi:2-methylcitrate dehydratase PrpD
MRPVNTSSATDSHGATAALAAWAAQAPGHWTDSAWRSAAHAFEDTIASMVAGAGDSGSAVVRACAFRGPVPVIGRTDGADAASAALTNGYAAHAVEMDENFLVGLGHLACSVLPGLLSIAHEADQGGEAVLDALIVASEAMARIGLAMRRAHTDRGWHGTATIGALAAAAGCGRLLRLDAQRMRDALSLAVSMAAGPKIQFGTQAKPLHAGLASQAGVWAARLAAHGLHGHAQALEGSHGFGALYGGVQAPDWSGIVPRAGEPLAIDAAGMAFKLWPACGATHRAIASTLALRGLHGFAADDVERVSVRVSHGTLVNLRYPDPADHKQAQFSMNYALALALERGALTLADFSPAALQDARIRALMPRITMQRDPDATEGSEDAANHRPHQVRIELRDGRVLEHETRHLKGSPQDPLNAAERQQKFDMCCVGQMPPALLDRLCRALQAPADIASLRELMTTFAYEAGCDDGQRFARPPFAATTAISRAAEGRTPGATTP